MSRNDPEAWISSDGDGFTLYVQLGRRKMQWDFEAGDQDPREFGESLRDVLNAMGETELQHYVSDIEQAIEGGEPVIDPRVDAPKVQREGDVLNSPTHGPYLRNAIAGGHGMRDGDDPYWTQAVSGLVDWDNTNQRQSAVGQVERSLRGEADVESFQAADTKVDYVARFQTKNSDHFRDGGRRG